MKAFTFSFDDAYRSWMGAADILEAHGFRGVFNVCTRSVVAVRKDRRARMFPPDDILEWGEVQGLQARGHEIASHGTRHEALPQTTEAELAVEIIESRRVFEGRGIGVTTYACAFNMATQAARALALEHYDTFRGPTGVNEWPARGRVYHAQDPATAIDSIADGVWAVGIWHDLDLERFAAAVSRVAAIEGVRVVTVREATADVR